MGRIIPKLNLNRTPDKVLDNSMIFAKNIRIDVDGSIHKDYSIYPMTIINNSYYYNMIYRFLGDFNELLETEEIKADTKASECITHYQTIIKALIEATFKNFSIIDIIAGNKEFYCFITTNYGSSKESFTTENFIIRFDEEKNTFYPCDCNWNYSGGKIYGNVINNLLGEKILVVCESETEIKVPLKCINLAKSSYTDDESIYTQTPNIPITNINYSGNFTYTIPNGVYQFFVRYKVRDDFYTDWFPASKEYFAGNNQKTVTNFGTLSYVNTNMDSDKSFIFSIQHLYGKYTNLYESFQIGFIASHDDEIVARAWKHFTFDKNIIKFDYKAEDAEEIEVTDLTKTTYNIYNVGNITSFKNKLYISNYTETNFDEDLQSHADSVKIETAFYKGYAGYGEYPTIPIQINGKTYIQKLKLSKEDEGTPFSGENGIIYKLLTTKDNDNNSISSLIKNVIDNKNTSPNLYINEYNLQASILGNSLQTIKEQTTNKYNSDYGDKLRKLILDDTITKVKINNNSILKNNIENYIYNYIKYLDKNAFFVNSACQQAGNFKIEITRSGKLSYEGYKPIIDKPITDEPLLQSVDTSISDKPIIDPTISTVIIDEDIEYTQTINISFTGFKDKLNTTNIDNLINYTTLVPYQQYKFYIHFIKQNGEITNGYYCGGANAGIITAPYKEDCNSIIYPVFSEISVPKGYVGCFFSIKHHAVYTSTIFNIGFIEKDKDGHDIIDGGLEGSCIEFNTGLIPASKDISILTKEKLEDMSKEPKEKATIGNYHYSGESSNVRYFGANGTVKIEPENLTAKDAENSFYAITDYESAQEENTNLIKCTPFITANITTYNDVNDLNLLGYICKVWDLDRSRTIKYYSDGKDVYLKENTDDKGIIGEDGNQLTFKELNNNATSPTIADVYLIPTEACSIYSNFNLNYISLLEEPKLAIKTYYTTGSETTDKDSKSLVWKLLSSLELSNTYKLESMYKSYTRKLYYPYNKNSVTRFDNTIRSSMLEGDEANISIFKFDSEDYYNVPTNKGKIVNLVSVGDSILVHTSDSLFKFTGSNNLQSSAGEIQPTETEVFNTGISEVFGSDFGFAGLQNKTDQIITENGYIFFDRDAKTIYMYGGNNQLIKISDSIEKLFRFREIRNIVFANDYYNNRFFICIWFVGVPARPVTLSYNFNQETKSFISVHDFCFKKAFNTKVNCYFISEEDSNICVIDKTRFGEYFTLEITRKDGTDIFINKADDITRTFTYQHPDTLENEQINVPIKRFYSFVDIICNQNFEIIKTLNSINWCSRYITVEYPEESINMADSENDKYPCSYMRIYTDTCQTELMNFSEISNDISITNPNSFKYPRYNQGYWSLNYFRNILNSSNSIENRANYVSDQNSLIEGRYIVARFLFNGSKDFKLETVNFNYQNKL